MAKDGKVGGKLARLAVGQVSKVSVSSGEGKVKKEEEGEEGEEDATIPSLYHPSRVDLMGMG
jgi:hypothetical protein